MVKSGLQLATAELQQQAEKLAEPQAAETPAMGLAEQVPAPPLAWQPA